MGCGLLQRFPDLLQQVARQPARFSDETRLVEREDQEAVLVEAAEENLVRAEHEQELVELAVARAVEHLRDLLALPEDSPELDRDRAEIDLGALARVLVDRDAVGGHDGG